MYPTPSTLKQPIANITKHSLFHSSTVQFSVKKQERTTILPNLFTTFRFLKKLTDIPDCISTNASSSICSNSHCALSLFWSVCPANLPSRSSVCPNPLACSVTRRQWTWETFKSHFNGFSSQHMGYSKNLNVMLVKHSCMLVMHSWLNEPACIISYSQVPLTHGECFLGENKLSY